MMLLLMLLLLLLLYLLGVVSVLCCAVSLCCYCRCCFMLICFIFLVLSHFIFLGHSLSFIPHIFVRSFFSLVFCFILFRLFFPSLVFSSRLFSIPTFIFIYIHIYLGELRFHPNSHLLKQEMISEHTQKKVWFWQRLYYFVFYSLSFPSFGTFLWFVLLSLSLYRSHASSSE